MFKNLGMREFYRLKGVLHYMRNHGLSLEEPPQVSLSTEGGTPLNGRYTYQCKY
jgi:hypothetical protein